MAGHGTPSSYTFGDSQLAADRLALLAAVFEPSSATLVELAAQSTTAVAVDLGCGPGFTTSLVARLSRAQRTIGLDASAAFVARARAASADPSVEFVVHDVARMPWPGEPADLVHARFLLAHLPGALGLLARWITGVTTGGRLVSDETERIDTDLEVFARYVAIARTMVARRGADLQVGARLRDAPPPPGTRIVHSACREIAPSTAVAARLFGMNFAAWRDDPFVVDAVPPRELDALADGLAELTESTRHGELVFCNRQVVYERS